MKIKEIETLNKFITDYLFINNDDDILKFILNESVLFNFIFFSFLCVFKSKSFVALKPPQLREGFVAVNTTTKKVIFSIRKGLFHSLW